MLSESEREAWRHIEAELVARDPGLTQSGTTADEPRTTRRRHSTLLRAVGSGFALLTLLSLAAGLPTGLFVTASLVLGALVFHLNAGGEI